MLEIIYKLCFTLVKWINLGIIRLKVAKGRRLVVFDIDNTLADTWPTLVNKKPGWLAEFRRIRSIPPLSRATDMYNDFSLNADVVFLSARPFFMHFVTKSWLSEVLSISNPNLILVESAESKIDFLNYFLTRTKDVTFIDDLSFNHENSDVKFYEDVINEVKTLKVKYYGLGFIKEYHDKII